MNKIFRVLKISESSSVILLVAKTFKYFNIGVGALVGIVLIMAG